MKKIENIQDWLDTDPSTEARTKVFNFIQRVATGENRQELEQKSKEHKKLYLAIKAMKESKLEVPKELNEKEKVLRYRIVDLERMIPSPKKYELP